MRFKATATTVLALALLGVSMLSGAAFAQPGPAVTITPGSLYVFGAGGGIPITYGWKFQPNTNLTITQLGFCDGAPFSTVGLDETHDVGIFDDSGSLIVSATVPAGTDAVLVDNFRHVAIPPTVLSSGAVYTIGAYLPLPKLDTVLSGNIQAGQLPRITLDTDLACHFLTSQLVIRPGDSTVVLEGTTFAGARFRGEDRVRIVPD